MWCNKGCAINNGVCAELTMLLWCALVMSSILPTRSVVETPCVLLHSLWGHRVADCRLVLWLSALVSNKQTHLYRPDFFTSSYVSFPSTVSVMSSAGTVKTWDSTSNWRARSVSHDTPHLRARRSQHCTCPGSPGWSRRAPPPQSHPPILWHAPSCTSPPGWRLADPYALQSHLSDKTHTDEILLWCVAIIIWLQDTVFSVLLWNCY